MYAGFGGGEGNGVRCAQADDVVMYSGALAKLRSSGDYSNIDSDQSGVEFKLSDNRATVPRSLISQSDRSYLLLRPPSSGQDSCKKTNSAILPVLWSV